MRMSTSPLGRWSLAVSVVVTAWLVCAPGVSAQQVMLSQPGATATYDIQASRVTWTAAGQLAPNGALYTADGRFALTGSASVPSVRVIDAGSGAYVDLPLPFEPLVAHPRDLAMYGLADRTFVNGAIVPGNPARLDVGGLTRYAGCPAGATRDLDLSGDGTRLFVLCESGQLAVVETVSGTVLHTLNTGTVTFKSMYNGSALVVVAPTFDAPVDLIDANTGALLNRITRPGTACTPSITRVSPDRTLGILSCYRITPWVPQTSSTLIAISRFALGLGPTLSDFTIGIASISPDNRTMYSTAFPSIGPGSVVLTDLSTGVSTRPLSNFFGSIAVSHPPLAPAAVAIVTGNQVDLTWTLPAGSPAATAHVLEIGTGPGLSNLGTVQLGSASTLTVPGVPTGRYYVRVRARNVAGVSAPSTDVGIDVP